MNRILIIAPSSQIPQKSHELLTAMTQAELEMQVAGSLEAARELVYQAMQKKQPYEAIVLPTESICVLEEWMKGHRRKTANVLHAVLSSMAAKFAKIEEKYRRLEAEYKELTTLNEECAELHETISESLKRMKTLHMGDVADFKDFDLDTLARTVLDTMKQGEWKLDVASKPFRIRADAMLLELLLFELLHNSREFSPDPAKLQLQVSAQRLDREGQVWVEIVYRDNGPGVPDEIKSKIFEYGFSHGRTTRKGRGLGLDFVKRVVEKHQGTIREQGRHRVGVEFVIELPLDPNGGIGGNSHVSDPCG
jgi:signal transduction histidine kinase